MGHSRNEMQSYHTFLKCLITWNAVCDHLKKKIEKIVYTTDQGTPRDHSSF